MLKWYDIAPADEPVPPDVQVLARGSLRAAGESGRSASTDDLGFVILHRCGESFYFLLVSTWRNDNELWETVWAKNGDDDVTFRPWPLEGTHRPTFCVWELGAVWHEQQAWSRFLRSPRGPAARKTPTCTTRSRARSRYERARGSEANRLQGSSLLSGCPGFARMPA